jgi:outer membrane immunogenic protein
LEAKEISSAQGAFAVKRIVLCIAVLAGLTGAVSAADMPVKAPPPAPVTTWDGIYAGAHFGYLWGRTRVTENGVVTEPNARTDGIVGGVLAGVNWQSGPLVLGLEADIGWSNAHGTGFIAVPVELPNQYDVRWTSYFRARGGFTVTPSTLLFVAGGLAVTDFRFQEGGTVLAPPITGAIYTGWTIGAGIEHILGQITRNAQVLGRLEYLYADFGSKTYVTDDVYTVNFRAQTVRGAVVVKFN